MSLRGPPEQARTGKAGQTAEPHRARQECCQPDPDEDGDQAPDDPHGMRPPTVFSTEDGLGGRF
jgi:hypothetical protein